MVRRGILGWLLAAAGLAGAAQASEAVAGGFRFESIDGGDIALDEFRGGPVMVVNTASLCGFVSQFEGLQATWERYRDRGLTVVGVPSHSFRQELGSEAEVKDFCEATFAIDFPMTTITPVAGEGAHPFYAWAQEQGAGPRWNFHKILLDDEGRIAASWGPQVDPRSTDMTEAIEALLPPPQ